MKVAIIAPSFGAFGGIEAFVCALAAALRAEPDVDVTLCLKKARGFRPDSLLERTLAQTDLPVTFADRASAKLRDVIRDAEIVHCQNPCIDVALIAKMLGKPLALTIHNYRQRSLRPRALLRAIAFRLANRCWYNSEFVWSTWEPDKRRPGSARLPVTSKLPSGIVPIEQRKGFVFVSRWIPNKGVDTLVEAYARARLDRERWPLVMLGDGPLRAEIESRIREKKILGIEIRGSAEGAARDSAIRYARWMVTPPDTKEDLGLTPLEARHVGVPCIITRDGGLPEAGGKYALSCEPGNVEELKMLLEEAAQMDDAEYAVLCDATHRELMEYLQPLSVYVDHYRELLHGQAEARKFSQPLA